MGQSNLPQVSKLGYSMYWQTMRTDKLNFTKKISEDIFLNMFLPIFFKRIFFQNTTDKLLMVETIKKRLKFKLRKSYLYCSKIWIIQYQTWILLIFYTYNPRQAKIKILKKQIKRNRQFFWNFYRFNFFEKKTKKFNFKNLILF